MKLDPGVSAAVLALAAGAPLPVQAQEMDNVVVVSVGRVVVPPRLPGPCMIHGRVREVLDGDAYRPGEPIAIPVPCAGHLDAPRERKPRRPPHHLVFDVEVLKRSRLGVARVDDHGGLIWRVSVRSYGRYGRVWGYRVLDGVLLPLERVPQKWSPALR